MDEPFELLTDAEAAYRDNELTMLALCEANRIPYFHEPNSIRCGCCTTRRTCLSLTGPASSVTVATKYGPAAPRPRGVAAPFRRHGRPYRRRASGPIAWLRPSEVALGKRRRASCTPSGWPRPRARGSRLAARGSCDPASVSALGLQSSAGSPSPIRQRTAYPST